MPLYTLFNLLRTKTYRIKHLVNKMEHGQLMSNLLQCKVQLDPSQVKAIKQGLTHRVALIQGPPGTGKSFVGALLAKAIYDHTDEVIMCVCYTNHALDQFLLDLQSHGIPKRSMVRIGGGKKVHPKLEDIMLDKLTTLGNPSKSFNRQFRETHTRIEEAERNIKSFSTFSSPDTFLLSYLERYERRWYERFRVEINGEEGMQMVGAKGKKMNESYLLNQWKKGVMWKNISQPEAMGRITAIAHLLQTKRTKHSDLDDKDTWSLSQERRNTLIDSWREAILSNRLEGYKNAVNELVRAQADLQQLKSEKKADALQGRRFIGCTTTGAAIQRDWLESVKIGVLIVEEAGEILESHIITALSSETKHLIMIGDHQQLRPKVNEYALQVESGQGYDLNCSLFERLIMKSNYPYMTLNRQHRMPPLVSSFIRSLTYPNLEDASSTTTKPLLRGIQNPVVFVDHTQLEDGMSGATLEDNGTNSKINSHEVKMVVCTTWYLVQQGYKSDQIVILTPYLGQLAAIRKAIKRLGKFQAALGDLDEEELGKAEEKGTIDTDNDEKKHDAKGGSSVQEIRLATIDNYQGEESDVVIISLVRSNEEGNTGFVSQKERVNVLLSRAREGMILFGNSHTLTATKRNQQDNVWKKAFPLFQEKGCVYEGLPVICQRHPESRKLLSFPAHFSASVPDGGCDRPCGVVLSCAHLCPKRCHPSPDHSKQRCEATMTDKCKEAGHIIHFKCYEKDESSAKECQLCKRLKAAKEEAEKKVAASAKKMAEMEIREKVKIAERKAQLEELEKLEAAEELSRKRQSEAQRLQVEIETLERAREIKRNAAAQLNIAHEQQLKAEAETRIENVHKQIQKQVQKQPMWKQKQGRTNPNQIKQHPQQQQPAENAMSNHEKEKDHNPNPASRMSASIFSSNVSSSAGSVKWVGSRK